LEDGEAARRFRIRFEPDALRIGGRLFAEARHRDFGLQPAMIRTLRIRKTGLRRSIESPLFRGIATPTGSTRMPPHRFLLGAGNHLPPA
jgi:hypothetical protein